MNPEKGYYNNMILENIGYSWKYSFDITGIYLSIYLHLQYNAAMWLLACLPQSGFNKENFAYYKHNVERLKEIICLTRPVIVYTQWITQTSLRYLRGGWLARNT